MTGRDQDFRVWKWKDILAAVKHPASAKKLQLANVDHLKRRTLGFRGALPPASEVNDVAQFMRQFEGHEDFLHAVRHLQHSQELVTGSEGGTLGIWDVRQEKKIEFLRPQPATQSSSASPALPSLWLGAVAHDESEMWLACGGGS
ncbi:THO complex subunit 6 [Phytophthora cinnamomi]|uniref:THO complex subunit 6 n=1 Tax=Phytophthora cinnamomi TaxID=4785 RepID=UPI0035595925|nr:THO complex subunit 6 [Phytophthora cinnamomi]